MVSFSFRTSNCRECNHPSSDTSHDLCRTHAYCARGSQYHGALCATCEDLWERAADLEDPEEAIPAFDALAEWIKGFRKNSRNRPKGQDHFYDPTERAAFQELYAKIAAIRMIPSLDEKERRTPPRPTQPTSKEVTPPPEEPRPAEAEDASEGSSDDSSPDADYVPTFTFVTSPQGSERRRPPSSSDDEGKRGSGLFCFTTFSCVKY